MGKQPNVDRLSRQVRSLAVANGFLAFLVLTCLILLLKKDDVTVDVQRETVSDLVVTDGDGHIRAQLSGTESGATLTLFDATGAARLELATQGLEPTISLFDETGRSRLNLYVTNAGGAATFIGSDGPRLWLAETSAGGGIGLYDHQGNRRVELGLIDYEPGWTQPRGLFGLYDEAGNVLYVLGE